MTHVVFAGMFAATLEPSVRTHLEVPCEISVLDETALVEHMAGVDVLVTMTFTPAMAATARRLKLVQVPGAGLDRIDRAALPPGAWLANAYGHETGMAEYVLGAMLAVTREFTRLDAALRQGVWASQWAMSPPPPTWLELAGKTLGILGYGRIGQSLARRARAFEMEVLAMRQDVQKPVGQEVDLLGGPEILDKVLQRADYVVLTLPLTPATRGLIGPAQLAAMKPTATLINVSRADIVDEEALYQALAERRIGAAVLDVWYRYPTSEAPTQPSGYPFHELSNVLMTPHVSAWTEGMLQARGKLIADNIARVTQGQPPMNLIPTPG